MGEYYDFGGLTMNIKSDEERKSKVMKIRLNDREFAKLKQYTEESGLRSMSEYIYNSILATPIIELTDEELAPEKARFKEIADRINSIATLVNQTGKIYPEDLRETGQGAFVNKKLSHSANKKVSQL